MPISTAQPESNVLAEQQDYHILIIEDFQGKQSIPLSYATYSVGRDPSNTIRIQDSAASRHHLILFRVPRPNRKYVYRVVDGDASGKASLNGITVNGLPCKQQELKSGDIIGLGEVTRIQYLIQSMTPKQFAWYFDSKNTAYRSIQETVLDPTATMTTILAT